MKAGATCPTWCNDHEGEEVAGSMPENWRHVHRIDVENLDATLVLSHYWLGSDVLEPHFELCALRGDGTAEMRQAAAALLAAAEKFDEIMAAS